MPGAGSGAVVVVVVVVAAVVLVVVLVACAVVLVVVVEASAGGVVVVATFVGRVVTGCVASSDASPHPAVTITNPTASTTRRGDITEVSSRRSAEPTRPSD
jgi:hypothetical protein